jgi:hypothetical protein
LRLIESEKLVVSFNKVMYRTDFWFIIIIYYPKQIMVNEELKVFKDRKKAYKG